MSQRCLVGLVGLISLAAAGCHNEQPQSVRLEPLKVQLAYPIYSLDPRSYDDWSSVFVANHIFPRLLPVASKPWVTAVAKDLQIACSDWTKPGVCLRKRVSFRIVPFQECSGRSVTSSQIREEFFAILKAKNWLFHEWKMCASDTASVCIEFPDHADTTRRLENIYFRFGWSHLTSTDSRVGAGAYCLSQIRRTGSSIMGGRLIPKGPAELPELEFNVTQDPNSKFNVALQGTKQLLSGSRRNVQPHTPLPYYVVSNAALAGRPLPWNSKETAGSIRAHLLETGMLYEAPPSLLDLAPSGRALSLAKQAVGGRNVNTRFLLPDYLPGCSELAKRLNSSWTLDGARQPIAECGNLVELVEKRIHRQRPVSPPTWGGFLISLSPGAPERNALSDQYFSAASQESLTGAARQPNDLFYRVGMGQSQVTVDGRVLCDVRANSLGLGDLTASDLIYCSERTRHE